MVSSGMDFLTWHYTFGLKFYVNRYLSSLYLIIHYFSLPLLIPTLFMPWKRLIIVSKKPGFNIFQYFQDLSFNIVSRFVGAGVRIILLIAGSITMLFVALAGFLGMLVWIFIPFLSIPIYEQYKNQPSRIIRELIEEMRNAGERRIEVLLKSIPGIFLVNHIGISANELISNASPVDILYSNKSDSFLGLMQTLFKKKVWPGEFLRLKGLSDDDFFTTAAWWDRHAAEKALVDETPPIKTAGIGLELLYGYTPTLDQYGTDLRMQHEYAHNLIGRQNLVKRVERSLAGGTSVLLIGPPGVGKKTVVLEFAHSATEGELGAGMSYRRLVELNSNFVLSESIDLNQKKVKLSQIFAESEAAGNIILVIRDIHRFTNPQLDGVDFTDIFEQFLEKRIIKMVAIATDVEYERFIAGNGRLRRYFDVIEVKEPGLEEAYGILVHSAELWEKKQDLIITTPALRKILEGSSRYITDIPFPEKALELLDAVVMYHTQAKKDKVISVEDVNSILSERTGISFASLTEKEIHRLTNLEEIIHQRLVSQEDAVSLIAKILRSKTVGVVNSHRPIGSFLFLGPSGVGKTETARVLAKVYYGSENEILRFDMAEYVGREGLERLIGSVEKNLPGALTTAIKNKPASLLLLDEIEKAPPQIYNLFLAMLDEGFITDAFGKRVSCEHLFIVATSNAGAEYIREIVSRNDIDDLQKQVTNYIMEKGIFSPEFINRFDGVVVYKPLSKEDLIKIARFLLLEMAHNLKQKNVYVEVSNEAAEKLASDGYEPEFGARPMRRIIDLSIGDLLGKAILEGKIKGGDKITILPGEVKNEFRWEKEVVGNGQS